jgi:group I intron endonuclease
MKNYRRTFATVYQLRNIVTGHSYIGVTIDLKARMNTHKQLKSNNCNSILMQEHYSLHGPESFELIELDRCDIDDMFEVEAVYIKHFAATSFIYNIVHAGKSNGYTSKIDDNMAQCSYSTVLPFI